MNNREGFFCWGITGRPPRAARPNRPIQTQGQHFPPRAKCQPYVSPASWPSGATLRLRIYSTNCPLRSVANALMFRAFGNRAGLQLFTSTAALKTVRSIVVFSTAFTSSACGVVINSRFLGHVTSPLLELCYALSLAPPHQGHKPSPAQPLD